MKWYENLKYKMKTWGGVRCVALIQRQHMGWEYTLFEFEVERPMGVVRKETNVGVNICVEDRATETVTIGYRTQELNLEDLLTQQLRDLSLKVVVYGWGEKEEYENLALMCARRMCGEGLRRIRFFHTKR